MQPVTGHSDKLIITMGINHLEFGDSVTGLLADSLSPRTAGTLFVRQNEGMHVEIPYLAEGEPAHFGHVAAWFHNQDPPRNLTLQSRDGFVSLFGLRWDGGTRNLNTDFGHGVLRPEVVVLSARDGDANDDLVVDELTSNVDGLNRWSGMTSLTESSTFQDGHREMAFRLNGFEEVSWRQGKATLSLVPDWRAETRLAGNDRGSTIQDMVGLRSTFDDGPRPVLDHLTEQQKVLRLLTLLFGLPISFRRHLVRDSRFTVPTASGRTTAQVELLTSWTIGEYEQPEPEAEALAKVFAGFTQVGTAGLEAWAANFESWTRFILPAVSVVGGRKRRIEDNVISTSIALEAAGRILGKRNGEQATYSQSGRQTVSTDIYRVLDRLQLDWSGIASSPVALSRLIADTYNGIKHFDRGELPSHAHAFLVSEINQHLVRAFALTLIGEDDAQLQWVRDANSRWQIAAWFRELHVELTEDGVLTQLTGDPAASRTSHSI